MALTVLIGLVMILLSLWGAGMANRSRRAQFGIGGVGLIGLVLISFQGYHQTLDARETKTDRDWYAWWHSNQIDQVAKKMQEQNKLIASLVEARAPAKTSLNQNKIN